MSRRKISQTDAWMYFHKSQRLERILQEQKNRWHTEWQDGWVNIETLLEREMNTPQANGQTEIWLQGWKAAITQVRRMYLSPEPEVDTCPVESTLRGNGVAISNDWLCPRCERVHEAILSQEPEASRKEEQKVVYIYTSGGSYKCTVSDWLIMSVSQISKFKSHDPEAPQPGEVFPRRYSEAEPEEPEEIKDLLSKFDAGGKYDRRGIIKELEEIRDEHNADIREAYRRGKESGK